MRKLPNFLAGFLDYTEGIKSPARFRSWACVSLVAGALERKVWVRVMDYDVYPNLYVLLVGPPASGKSLACKAASTVARKISTIRLAPNDVTTASFYDAVEEAAKTTPRTNAMPYIHHSLTALISELGQFLKEADTIFMNALTEAYDCEEVFHKRRRTTESNTIQNIWFNMLGCVTPRYLAQIITPQALEQGFPSRCIQVYCDRELADTVKVPLFRHGEDDILRRKSKATILELLQHDLEDIHLIQGEFVFDLEASDALQKWVDSGMQPMPMDSRFEYYCDRRVIHFVKLATVISAMRNNSKLITLEDFYFAKQFLTGAEQFMHKAVEAMGSNQLYVQMQSAVKFVEAYFAKNKKPTPEHILRQRLHREVPLNMMDFLLDSLVNARELERTGGGRDRFYSPMKK